MAKKLTNKTSYNYGKKIDWTKEDYKRLRKAINTFNKEVTKHSEDIPDKALPKLKQYKEVKSSIYSRKDLDLVLSTLGKIKNKSAFKLIKSNVNPNVKFTNWEYQTAKRYDYRNRVKINIEYNDYISGIKKSSKPILDIFDEPVLDEQGRPMSKAAFSSTYKSKLESYLRESNVEMLLRAEDNYRKNLLLERMFRRGTDMFEYQKDKIYKENYLKMFEGYENLDNYDEVVKKLKSIDAKDFFKFIKKNDTEGFENFSDHYDNRMLQIEFNEFAKRIGVDIDETFEPVTENIEDIF